MLGPSPCAMLFKSKPSLTYGRAEKSQRSLLEEESSTGKGESSDFKFWIPVFTGMTEGKILNDRNSFI
jgi:hypothetical protein